MVPYAAYYAEAGQLDFTVPFPFLNRSHVLVRSNGVLQSLAPWPGPGTVRLLLPASHNAFIEIERETPLDGPLVEFQNGAVLTSEDLNTAVLQLLYKQQELTAAYDRVVRDAQTRLADAGGLVTPSTAVWDTLVAHVLEMEVVNTLLGRLTELDQNAQAIVQESLNRAAALEAAISSINVRTDGLFADALASIQALRTEHGDRFVLAENRITTVETAQTSYASQLSTLAAGYDANTSAIITEQTTRANADSALSTRIDNLIATSGDVSAMIVSEQTARANADAALAEDISALQAQVGGTQAEIAFSDKAEANDLEALAESIVSMTANYGLAKATFKQQISTNATDIAAQAAMITGLQASYDTNAALIASEQTARATADTALSTRIDAVVATAASNQAAIVSEQTARANADGALSTRIDAVVATAGANQAAIVSEQTARATADTALGTRIDAVTADLDGVEASVLSEQTARVNADGALGTRIDGVIATTNGKNRTFFQGTTPTATAVGDLWFNTSDNRKAFRWNGTVWEAADDERTAVNTAAIATEATARANADGALSTRIDAVVATAGSNTAAIQSEQTARANADSTLSSRIDSVVATANSDRSSLTGQITTNSAAIVTEQTARANADSALSSRIDAVKATADGNSALIGTEQTTRASADSALSSRIDAVTSTVNGHTASINTVQTSTNGLLLKHSVTLNSNGHITGFSQNNDGASGTFTVVADNFKIVAPGGGTPVVPFSVTADGVRIDGNLVVTGSITGPALAPGSVTTNKIVVNSVLAPSASYGSAQVNASATVPPTWQTVRTATITSVGAPVLVMCSALVKVTLGYLPTDNVRLVRNDTVVLYGPLKVGVLGTTEADNTSTTPVSFSLVDLPGTGTHTYSIQVLHQSTTGMDGLPNGSAYNSVVLLELRSSSL